jgi:hypothetical protein
MSGSSKQTQNQSSETSPWAPQASALQTAFSGAQGALSQAQSAKAPTDFTAQMTPEQLSTFRSMLGYANGSNVASSNNATGDALANAGTAGLQGALSGLLGYKPTDATDSNIANATKYANNPAISDMTAAAMRDATQEAHDVTLPAIDRAASVTGNVNNSRAGIANGLVERGLAQKAGDISANLRGTAYDAGLNRASADNQFNVSSLLSSLNNAGSLAGGAAAAGVGARSGSISDAGNLFNIAGTGGSGLQAADQARLTNQEQQYEAATNDPFAALKNYMSIVGANNFGSSTTGTSSTTSTPSAWQVIGGLLGAAGSGAKTAGSLGWTPFG